MWFALIVKRMNSIKADTIHMIFVCPITGIIGKKVSHWPAASSVKVQRRSPRCLVIGRKIIGAERAQIIPIRSKMIEDHIKDDSQTTGVSSINKPAQPVGATIDM